MKVFVVNQAGKPLMPTSPRKARLLLRDGQAKIFCRKPFTIQLLYKTGSNVQDVTLGIDAGYGNIGFSIVTEKEELVGGEVKLLEGMSERLTERAMYRRNRRNRLRHRKPRFDNRARRRVPPGCGKQDWLAPSIQHKLDTHTRLIEMYKRVLPIKTIIIETANFDIQAIKDAGIAGVGYQNGEQAGFWNLREYILHRDNHACQSPVCVERRKQKQPKRSEILQVHHIGFWKQDRTDRPGNLNTLCDKCHVGKEHQPKGMLYGWEPKLKGFKPETFMSTVRWRLINRHDAINTFGYVTKSARIGLELPKSHHNDAFVIACGAKQKRTAATIIEQRRRNNRSLETFKDAKYIDVRDGEIKGGKDLASGRRKRNKNLSGENLRQYRGQKVRCGVRSVRKQRYSLQPGDIVSYKGQKRIVKGTHSYGKSAFLYADGKPENTQVKNLVSLRHNSGLAIKPIVLKHTAVLPNSLKALISQV